MNPASMLSLALTYGFHGVAVLPCREDDRGGGGAKAPYNYGGWHNASSNGAQIREWWERWPRAVVGLPCRLNGIIAIDADRHGQDDGVAALFALCEQYGFDHHSVPCILTPRLGMHCLFRRPAHFGDLKARISAAIDIRDKAYVIAAGSVMSNGLRYQLHNGSSRMLAAAIGENTLPEPPSWLGMMVGKPDLPVRPQSETIMEKSIGDARKPIAGLVPNGDARQRIAGLLRKVALSRPGERNSTLHWAACRAGELVRAGMLQHETAIALFTEAGRQAGLPGRETIATVKSGIAEGSGVTRHGR